MIQQILLCIEGSPSGQRAIELCMSLATRLRANVAGLAIVDEPDIRAGLATGIGGASYKKQRDDALVLDAEEHVHTWLAEFSARCKQAGVAGRPLEERGQPAATILEAMQSFELTFMGRHANFKFETVTSDSQTRDVVLHRAKIPVIVVPEQPAIESRMVMAAFDGSSASKRALRSFAESGLLMDGDAVQVVCVDDDGADAWEMASRGVEVFRELGIKASPVNVVSTLPTTEALLEARAKMNARIMVMGAYASSRFSALLWGSVTRELVEKTAVPLYLHH